MPARATSRNNWFTDKKVTYHRDVKRERAEKIREAKAERARRAREDRERRARDRRDDGARRAQLKKEEQEIKRLELAERRAKLERKRADAEDRKIEREWREKGHRNPPCATTRKQKVTDRAKRYRANQPGCRPSGRKQCKLCQSRSDVMVDHADGNESNGRKSNLRWLCRTCNNTLGAEMARLGIGRRTVQYNPQHKGAQTLGEYMAAVLQHTRGAHDAAGKIIHETPRAKRREFASEIWARRVSHGTDHPGSGDAPDWVTNGRTGAEISRRGREDHSRNASSMGPRQSNHSSTETNPSAPTYSLALYDGLSRRGDKHHFHPGTLELANREAQKYADDMGLDAVLYDADGRMLARFTTNRPHSWRANPATAHPTAGNPRRQVNGGSSPNDSEEYRQSKKIAELFHGRAVKEEITVTEQIREHDWLWRIGPLVSLKVRTLTKKNITIPFAQTKEGMVHLFCSPDGTQFYLRGGDTELDLKPIGMGPGSKWFRDLMVIGDCKEITYEDRKSFHHLRLIQYFHKLGEVTKVKPVLTYNTLAHKLEILGGQYYVETSPGELIDGVSPGVVN